MPEYKSPGVYIEEVDRGTKPIEAAGTSMTAFVGITAEASRKQVDPATGERVPIQSVLNQPTLVTSWTQYVSIFGDFIAGAYLPDAVYGYFTNGGGSCYVVSVRALREGGAEAESAAATVPAKGRGNAFKVVAKATGPSNLSVTIKAGEEDTFSVTVGGETKAGLTMKKGEDTYVGNVTFSAVEITDVGAATATPTEGTYELTGGGIPPLTVDDFAGTPRNARASRASRRLTKCASWWRPT